MSNTQSRADLFLKLIGIFKIVKAVAFWAVAIGVLHFLHRDIQASLMQVLDNSHVDSDNHVAQWAIKHAGGISPEKVGVISFICFFYGCLFATEGVGLYLRKKWAEYFVIIITASLLPIEFYELIHKFHWAKLVLICGNLAILAFLIAVICNKPSQKVTALQTG